MQAAITPQTVHEEDLEPEESSDKETQDPIH
jgi:hypothetical protein